MKFEGFAHGKLILFGEHAVAYGHGAIAIPITLLETRVIIERSRNSIDGNDDLIINGQVMSVYNCQSLNLLDHLVFRILKLLPKSLWNIEISIKSNIPMGEGLGSSAALCIAMANAFKSYIKYYSKIMMELELKNINIDPNELETIFHGNPSGIDVATCTNFFPIAFKNGKIKKIEQLNKERIEGERYENDEINSFPFKIVIISSGIVRNTKIIMEQIKENRDKMEIDTIMKNIGDLMDQINSLDNYDQINKLTRRNHELLQELGVSESRIDEFIKLIWKKYKIPGKITGAGCGGCFYFLLPRKINENNHENNEEIIEKIQKEIQNYQGFKIITIL